MTSWNSYPKIHAIGTKWVQDLLQDDVVVQEKVDGSQFSFGIFDGEIKIKSKRVEMDIHGPQKMFAEAAAWVEANADRFFDGWTYRGEYLQKPKHNVLCYDRIPENHIILFDIAIGAEDYLPPNEVLAEATRLGLEMVPTIYTGKLGSAEQVFDLLLRQSVLGGVDIEGLVVKNYSRFTHDGKTMMAKHVSERFKEIHGGEWKKANPTQKDILGQVIDKFRTEARWDKCVQHLRDDGLLAHEPRDIGLLMKEFNTDFEEECREEIKNLLYLKFRKDILRRCSSGLPEWYKEQLVKGAFDG